MEFLIEHQDNFLIRLSQPPTTNIENLALSVSVPQPDQARPDVADLSDSDEELGELTMHEGGGAKLARRSTSAGAGPSSKKSGGLFKSRKQIASTSRVVTDDPLQQQEAGPSTSSAGETASLALPVNEEGSISSQEKKRAPSPRGEIMELELTESPIIGGNVNLRRSRTVPSRRSQEERGDEKRSASGGKAKGKRDFADSKIEEATASTDADPSSETVKIESANNAEKSDVT